MKRKSLLILVSLLAISTHAYATQQSWHLIKHKEWATGNIKSIFKTASLDESPRLKYGISPNNAEHEYNPITKILDTTNINAAGEPSSIDGASELHIFNYSGSSKSYTIDRNICVFKLPSHEFGACSSYEDIVEIDISYSSKVTSHFSVIFPSPGDYAIDLTTTITHSNDNKMEIVSEDYRYITVKDK